MSFESLTRDTDYVLSALLQMDDGSVVAGKSLKVVFPVWFEENQLASIASDVYVLGMLGFIVDDKYSTSVVPANIRFLPTSISKEKYDEMDYYVLEFEKGETVIETTSLVKENTMGYYVYHSLVDIGKVPWYMSAINMTRLFDGMNEYTGVTYGDNHAVPELIVSMIMRDKLDANVYYRQVIDKQSDIYENPPQYIALRNVPLGARNTTAKLMGSYFKEGLNSALMYPSETTERVEQLLRQ